MQPQDWSVYAPSSNAERTYRYLRRANYVFYALLAFIALCGIWNVIAVSGMIRGGAVDLADVKSIQDHISARLVNILTIAALAVFAFKEWKWGDRNFSMVFVLGLMLFLWLVPVMSAEVQPAEENLRMEITYRHCAPGAIEGDSVRDGSECDVVTLEEGDIWMSPSNPQDGDFEMLPPDSVQASRTGWNVTARGHFTVYFMMPQDSLETCENLRLTTSLSSRDAQGHYCVEHEGTAYSVHPVTTLADANVWFTIYEEVDE